MTSKPTILIIDDERNTREGLKLALQDNYRILLADNAIKGLDFLRKETVQIVLTDLRMPGIDGLDFIRQAKEMPSPPLIVLITAYGSVQTALDAMKAGAYDYVTKPVDIDNLEAIITRGIASLAEESSQKQNPSQDIITNSPAMQDIMAQVRQVADTRATILITGESGTGKEVVARAIHEHSKRASLPFIPVHCAALNENLLESELFGHEKGAYTGAIDRQIGRFEAAGEGTIFLDEIGEISPAIQVKLLRVLENKTFERVGGKTSLPMNARILAATNRDLPKMVADGTFREDLYYRLNVVEIHIPPLRERKEDIEPMLLFFLHKAADENNRHIAGFSPEAMKLLTTYNWPGNVREIRNTVERMVVLTRGAILTMTDIPREVLSAVAQQFSPAESVQDTPQQELDIHQNEKSLILQALKECNGNKTAAAKKLNISRRTLQRKIQEYNAPEQS